MNAFLKKILEQSPIAICIALFVAGGLVDHFILFPAPTYKTDTTAVSIPPPAPFVAANIPAKVTPDTVYRDAKPDTTMEKVLTGYRSSNNDLKAQIDSLLKDKDSARVTLAKLLAEHSGETPFDLKLGDTGYVAGTASLKYAPMTEMFGLVLAPSKLYIPQITKTQKQPFWVKPAAVLGGAATAYFITEKNSTGALIAGGVSLATIVFDF